MLSTHLMITVEYMLGTLGWIPSSVTYFYVTLSTSLNLLKPQFLEYEMEVIVNYCED